MAQTDLLLFDALWPLHLPLGDDTDVRPLPDPGSWAADFLTLNYIASYKEKDVSYHTSHRRVDQLDGKQRGVTIPNGVKNVTPALDEERSSGRWVQFPKPPRN